VNLDWHGCMAKFLVSIQAPWTRFERTRTEGLNLNSTKPSVLALDSHHLQGESL
jgi:hypothetical protein